MTFSLTTHQNTNTHALPEFLSVRGNGGASIVDGFSIIFDLPSTALFYLPDPMISFSVHIIHALHEILAIWAAPLSVAPSIAPFSSRMGPKKLLLSGGQSVRRIKYNYIRAGTKTGRVRSPFCTKTAKRVYLGLQLES